MVKKRKLVKVSEKGHRIGEDHQRAKLLDKEVDVIRDLCDEGEFPQTTIAAVFDVSKSLVGKICRYERRNTTMAGAKTVHINEDD
jgi:hypothetical protein